MLIALYSGVAGEEVGQMKDLKSVLVEDVLLRGFPPLLLAQETLDYVMEARLAPIQEVRQLACLDCWQCLSIASAHAQSM